MIDGAVVDGERPGDVEDAAAALPFGGTVFQLTSLLFSVSVAPGPGPIVPLAIPPPAPEALLPVTRLPLRTACRRS